jgi:hypothetical protein
MAPENILTQVVRPRPVMTIPSTSIMMMNPMRNFMVVAVMTNTPQVVVVLTLGYVS